MVSGKNCRYVLGFDPVKRRRFTLNAGLTSHQLPTYPLPHARQARLERRAEAFGRENSSWLQVWWNKLSYLEYRDPVVIFVSYFVHFEDDPNAAPAALVCPPPGSGTAFPAPPAGPSPALAARRAASLCFHMLKYRELVKTGSLVGRLARVVLTAFL